MEKVFTKQDMEKAFLAGQSWIWEDLEQTTTCPEWDTFQEWFKQSEFKEGGGE